MAIVTGASSGIGREVATLLAGRGYRTILMARRAQRLQRLAEDLSRLAPSVAVTIDLGDASAIEPAMRSLLARHGPARVLVNNAGVGYFASFTEHSMADHHRLMQINYFLAVTMTRLVLPGMLEQGRGHVINVTSMSAKMGPWGHAGYASAKAALTALTQTLAAEHEGTGVHFSYVKPGIVASEFFDDPRFAPIVAATSRYAITPQRVARRIVGLLDRPRLEICVPRYYRILDLIKALSPTLAHRIVARHSRPRTPTPSDRPNSLPAPSQSGK